ncbi:MAG: sugar phosphate nucleotidyltransferase [Patescibacteria group bacterium]|jgi:molybdopterin-guanine dinucleotide biosynthesis protein A
MKEALSAVILAGGKGERMGGLTKDKQKCMLEIDGAPVLEHILGELWNAFGPEEVNVIIVTGHKGNEVREYFGNECFGIKIDYVHDEKPLETKGRLLLAKELITRPFLFLAGDVIAPNQLMLRVAERFEEEKETIGNEFIGVISGAKYHTPALTHALISVYEGFLADLVHPPASVWGEDQLREMHVALYDVSFISMAQNSDEKLLSRLINKSVRSSFVEFAVEEYVGDWKHISNPEDLAGNNLNFLSSYNKGKFN